MATPQVTPFPMPGPRHDPATTGQLRGRIEWAGPAPEFLTTSAAIPHGEVFQTKSMPRPYQWIVDPKSQGLAGVLIELAGIPGDQVGAWSAGSVEIRSENYIWQTLQNHQPQWGPGLCRLGEPVAFTSTEPELQVLRARGVLTLGLTFTQPGQRSLTALRPGWLHLSSGASYHWQAADVRICEHPYFCVSNKQGDFELTGVPPGSYTLRYWVRRPEILRQERDPESGLPFRTIFAAPHEGQMPVQIQPKTPTTVSLSIRPEALKPRTNPP